MHAYMHTYIYIYIYMHIYIHAYMHGGTNGIMVFVKKTVSMNPVLLLFWILLCVIALGKGM